MNSLNKYIFVYLDQDKRINIKKQNIKEVFIDISYSIMKLGLNVNDTATFILLHNGNSITLENPTFVLFDGEKNFTYSIDWNFDSKTEEKFKYDDIITHNYNGAVNPIVNFKSLSPIKQINLSGHSDISTIVLPSSVNVLSASCLQNCDNLESVRLSPGVLDIQSKALNNCTKLKSINIPNTVQTLGNDAFNGCVGTSVTIDYATYITLKNSLNSNQHLGIVLDVATSDTTAIENSAFQNCAILYDIKLDDNITTIYAHAFENCKNLESIQLPANLQTLNNAAFANCQLLTTITLPIGITRISDKLFQNCKKLKTVTINGIVETIGECAFEGCSDNGNGLTAFNFGNVKTIGISSFANSDIKTATFQNTLTSICESAFDSCKQLNNVILPSSGLQYIGNYAFCKNKIDNPEKLTTVSFPTTLEKIGEYAYTNNALTSIAFDSNVISVGAHCFESNALKSVSVGNLTTTTTTVFGENSFANNTQLTSFTSQNTTNLILDINDGMFLNCTSLTSFPTKAKILLQCDRIGNSAFENCSALKCLSTATYATTNVANPGYIGDNAFRLCTSLTSLGLNFTANANTNLTSIGASAFASCSTLPVSGFTLPKYVKTILSGAFTSCIANNFGANFWKLNANSLLSVCDGAFEKCSKLSKITTSTKLKYIGDNAFRECTALVDPSLNTLTSLQHIGDRAFYFCKKMTKCVFPPSLRDIGYAAFWKTTMTTPKFTGCTQLTSMGDKAFSTQESSTECAKITSIVGLKDTKLTSIGSQAFANQIALKSIGQMPPTLVSIDLNDVFRNCQALTGYTFANVFNGCTELTSVNMPYYIKQFGETQLTSNVATNGYTFKNCNKLTELTFPENCQLTAFRNSTECFAGCTSLENIDFKNCTSLTAIGGGSMFRDCTNLKTISLYSTKQALSGDAMFQNCTSLTSINGLTNVIQLLGANMFLNCSNIEEFCPTYDESLAATNFYKTDFFSGCTKLKKIKLQTKTTTIFARMFYNTGLQTLGYDGNMTDGKCVLPTTIKEIALSAFSNSKISDFSGIGTNTKLTTIGNYAFSDCQQLTAITIPSTATTFGQYVFNNCKNLNEITFNLTKAKVVGTTTGTLKNYAYLGCNNGTIIHCTDGDLIYPNKS